MPSPFVDKLEELGLRLPPSQWRTAWPCSTAQHNPAAGTRTACAAGSTRCSRWASCCTSTARIGTPRWAAITQMLTEKSSDTAPAILFDEVPGYAEGLPHAVRPFLVDQARRADARACRSSTTARSISCKRYHARMQNLKTVPAALREGRTDPAERDRRRRGRRAEIPGAAPSRAGHGALHRHRRLRDHAGSRRRLVQPRRLSHPGLRRQDDRLPDHRGQARPHPSRQVFRARPADEGRDPVRPGPAAVHAGGQPAAGASASWISPAACAASRSTWSAGPTRASRSRPNCEIAIEGETRARQGPAGRTVRRVDGLLLRRHPAAALCRREDDPLPQRSDPVLRAAAQAGGRDRPAQGHRRRRADLALARRLRRARGARRLEPRGRPGDALHRDPDPPALSGPRAPGAARRGRLPGRRLCRQMDGRGRRRHRRRRARPGAVGDVHALRSQRPTST